MHISFFLALLLFALSGLLGAVCMVFFSVLFHEVAHIVAARCCGYVVKEIELLPFGGVAKIERFGDFASEKIFFTAAAGPVASLCLAMLGFFLAAEGSSFWRLLGETNLALALFNLLPAFPLDGSHMARVLLTRVFPYLQATRLLVYASRIIGGCMLAKVLYDGLYLQVCNLSVLLVAVFIFFAAGKELKCCPFHAVRVMAYKKADLFQKGWMAAHHYAVRKDTCVRDVTPLFGAERYALLVVLDEAHGVCGTVTESEVWDALASRGVTTRFEELLSR